MNLESKCVEKYAGNDIELLDTHGVLQLGPFPFLFDIEDLPIIKSHIWYRDKDGYLVSCYYYNGQQRFVRFHRIVMHAQAGQFVDHINKNRADNRKQNLRCCNRSENMRKHYKHSEHQTFQTISMLSSVTLTIIISRFTTLRLSSKVSSSHLER